MYQLHASHHRRLGPLTAVVAVVALAASACGSGSGTGDSTVASNEPSSRAGFEALSAAPAGSSTPLVAPSVAPTASAFVARAASLPSDLPSRVVIPALAIDLPVVSGDLALQGNPPDYPLCDVAQFLTTYRYPGRPGTTTWVYGHAREGMFLSLLQASERDDGRRLVGMTVHVYSDAPTRYTYRITDVLRHATDRGIARDVPDDGRRLVLQTSEGPKGTVPKLQVAAEWIASQPATVADAQPSAEPRTCHQP